MSEPWVPDYLPESDDYHDPMPGRCPECRTILDVLPSGGAICPEHGACRPVYGSKPDDSPEAENPNESLDTKELRKLGELVSWALDQNHDTADGNYFWFLADEEDGETSDDVKEIFNRVLDKLARGKEEDDGDQD
jgi:hypothetical protein